MSDIVERLRRQKLNAWIEHADYAESFHQAADEIERLTAELAGVDKAWDECRTDKRKLRAKLAAAEKAVVAVVTVLLTLVGER